MTKIIITLASMTDEATGATVPASHCVEIVRDRLLPQIDLRGVPVEVTEAVGNELSGRWSQVAIQGEWTTEGTEVADAIAAELAGGGALESIADLLWAGASRAEGDPAAYRVLTQRADGAIASQRVVRARGRKG